ncbi:MAG: hypothetical protein LBJ00_17715 [Planctomycetaceae bacterium]|jgi:hypothetical protein|nr:hypothetical protein [Planctomycetaceae bacterium]
MMIMFLLFFVAAGGCANYGNSRSQVNNPLLQANRRLEEALVVTHNQLVDLKRENELLKANAAGYDGDSTINNTTPLPLIHQERAKQPPSTPTILPPQVIIPDGVETTTVPDALKGTMNETLPVWQPNR